MVGLRRARAGWQDGVVATAQHIDLDQVLADLATEVSQAEGGRRYQTLYRALRAGILSGTLPPDTKVTEAAVLQAFRLSRTPVREAFRLLEAEDLVTYSPSRGVVVRGLRPIDLVDIYEMLEALESLAARLAAQRIDEGQLEELESILELMQFYGRSERWQRVTREGIRFHQLVYRASGNARLEATLLDLRDYVRGNREAGVRAPGRGHLSVAEHVAIYQAIAARDPERAAHAAWLHLKNSSHQALGGSATTPDPD